MFPLPPFPLKREPTASAPRGDTLSTRIDCYRSLFMSLVRGRKNQTRPLTCTIRQARRSLSRRLAARTSNRHIPFISTPWIGVRSGVGVPHPQLQRSCNITCAKRKYHCCQRQQYHARFACISLTLPLRLALRINTYRL